MEFEESDSDLDIDILAEIDSSIVFFSGHARQLQNDCKIVSSSTPAVLKEITLVQYRSEDSEEVNLTYEGQMVKNTDKYVYFFNCSAICDAEDDEYGPMESPINGVFVKTSRRPRRKMSHE